LTVNSAGWYWNWLAWILKTLSAAAPAKAGAGASPITNARTARINHRSHIAKFINAISRYGTD
jgi:hypothetical protein